MTYSYLTDQIRRSPQHSARNGAKIDTILWHHQAGTNDDAVIDMMVNRTRQVSSNYTISNEGRLTSVVDEDLRAWTSGSTQDGGKGAAWDRRAITTEIENQAGAPNWPISTAAIDKAARLQLDLETRYDIKNVLGHRDLWTIYRASYATYCPGPETVARINARAAELRGQFAEVPPPKPQPNPVVPAQPAPGPPQSRFNFGGGAGKTAWKGLQRWLARDWGYSGLIDGIPGSLTWTALQHFLKRHWGYAGEIDGLPGPLSWSAAQRWLKHFYKYTGRIDGIPGPLTFGSLKRAGATLGKAKPQGLPRTPIDGLPGSITWRRGQTWLAKDWGYQGAIDGIPGVQTWSAMQRFLKRWWGYEGLIDGIPGPMTYRAMQRWLKAKWGYEGRIDGIAGPMTWSAFQRYVNSV